MREFSLYVHIPYCIAKCPYCDFNSHAATQWPEQRYTDALLREIDHFGARAPWEGGRLGTIFFGGGTPSLFEPESIRRIIGAAKSMWSAADGDSFEVTVEANPGSVNEAKLAGFLEAGVNRMSFGVQSFLPHHLKTLGRIHDGPQAVAALRGARAAGFDNVSLDLIFALPEQHPAEWRGDLEQACELEPNHISAYNLTYEEGTPFHHWRASGRLQPLGEDDELEMFNDARTRLGAAGYQQYEISNYAQPSRECRHNLNYWRSGPYLGIGAGAHSYSGCGPASVPPTSVRPGSVHAASVHAASVHSASVRPVSVRPEEPLPSGVSKGVETCATWGQRWSNRKSPGLYMEDVERRCHAADWSEDLDEGQARGEFVFLGLRCLNGFAAAAFERRFECDVETAFPHVADFRRDGFLRMTDGCWALSERGLLVADTIFATFL